MKVGDRIFTVELTELFIVLLDLFLWLFLRERLQGTYQIYG